MAEKSYTPARAGEDSDNDGTGAMTEPRSAFTARTDPQQQFKINTTDNAEE